MKGKWLRHRSLVRVMSAAVGLSAFAAVVAAPGKWM